MVGQGREKMMKCVVSYREGEKEPRQQVIAGEVAGIHNVRLDVNSRAVPLKVVIG